MTMTKPLLALSFSLILFAACSSPDAEMGAFDPEVILPLEVRQTQDPLFTIAFGSCSDENKAQPMLDRAAEQDPDVFMYLGDNIYGDTYDMDKLAAKYATLHAWTEFQRLLADTEVQPTSHYTDLGRA